MSGRSNKNPPLLRELSRLPVLILVSRLLFLYWCPASLYLYWCPASLYLYWCPASLYLYCVPRLPVLILVSRLPVLILVSRLLFLYWCPASLYLYWCPASLYLYWCPASLLYWCPASLYLYWCPASLYLYWCPASLYLYWCPASLYLYWCPPPCTYIGAPPPCTYIGAPPPCTYIGAPPPCTYIGVPPPCTYIVFVFSLQYTPELIAGPGADLDPSEVTIQGCECRGQSCVVGRCPCLLRGENYVNGRVTLSRDTPILECHALCGCAETCANRETQRGLQFRLQVCKVPGKGWGLHTKEAVPSGRFVCEYAGEVLGEEEACLRIKSQDPNANNYIIAVREHLHDGRTLHTYVDPTRIGNIGRFLNHSCRPNLVMLPVRCHSMVPRLALFAARDIQAGEELCYDYSGRSFNAEPQSPDKECAGHGGPGAPEEVPVRHRRLFRVFTLRWVAVR
ncbi:unnamed protein product [Staurois parvus]|uniref:Histone-lysine N-methyltransferase SETMAR n=1 Tax=Staurois parvus TaxID=386267 RepID=A0ABN9FVW7_9NEOB|nr:unnamed protein product [Staurois parvus]